MKQIIKKLAIVLSVALVCAPMGAMAANKLIVKDATGTIDKMVVTDAGTIGLGTSAPAGVIHSVGNSYATTQYVGQWIGTSNNGGAGFLGFHNNASLAPPNALDRIGYFMFGSYNTDGVTRLIGGGMTVRAEQTWTATSYPTSISFETAGTTGARVERLKITGSGNIGIGQSAPTQKLEVFGGVRLNTTTARPTCDATSRGTFWFVKGGTNVADTATVCAKLVDGSYSWNSLF